MFTMKKILRHSVTQFYNLYLAIIFKTKVKTDHLTLILTFLLIIVALKLSFKIEVTWGSGR